MSSKNVKENEGKPQLSTTPTADCNNPIDKLTKNGFAEIVQATKCANAFPQGAARDLYCAYPSFGQIVDEQSDRILGLISKVLKWQNIRGNIQRRQEDEQFEMLLECNDAIMERLNSNLDELSGVKRRVQPPVFEPKSNVPIYEEDSKAAGSWNRRQPVLSQQARATRQATAKMLERPQSKFSIPVDNSANTPFIPKIKDKPNSLKPLAVLPEYDENGEIVSYLHPYEFELMRFEVPEEQLKRKIPSKPAELDSVELFYVNTKDNLQKALQELRQYSELAIDLEHHSYRSFLGFTCLLQISTRGKDYIFDTLALREELHVLNEVFTNPKVLKIFHGADSDIEWLQRDLSLYVVNMFDTYPASKALNFARFSLAFLLKRYCNIDADKSLQLADWRLRPLPPDLLAYARQDTHFLIYIYECLTNELLDAANGNTNLLASIYQRSTEICKKRFVKPITGPDSHLDIYRKSKRLFDNRQLYALHEIFQWRERMARQEDESYGYVLPNHMMLQIAESLPREMQGIVACCNPVPSLVRQYIHDIHQIILSAREQPLIKPTFQESSLLRNAMADRDKVQLFCPFDLPAEPTNDPKIIEDLPAMLNIQTETISVNSSYWEQPGKQDSEVYDTETADKCGLNIFDSYFTPSIPKYVSKDKEKDYSEAEINFVTPYQRYMAIIPLMEIRNREEAENLAAQTKKRKLCPDADISEPPPPTEIKQEPQSTDELYSMPIKQLLKRKHEEALERKSKLLSETNRKNEKLESPAVKRFKTETPTDDKLNFNQHPPLAQLCNSLKKHKQQQIVFPLKKPGKPTQNDEAPSTSTSTSTLTSSSTSEVATNNFSGKKYSKNNKYKFVKKNQTHQSSDMPVQANFDYKTADFRKFQGGAQRAKGSEIKPQIHGKSNTNKATNKKFNKLFTFSNVKNKK